MIDIIEPKYLSISNDDKDDQSSSKKPRREELRNSDVDSEESHSYLIAAIFVILIGICVKWCVKFFLYWIKIHSVAYILMMVYQMSTHSWRIPTKKVSVYFSKPKHTHHFSASQHKLQCHLICSKVMKAGLCNSQLALEFTLTNESLNCTDLVSWP